MEKYITNIKDLVIQFMTNGQEIEAKAKEGDAASCFQMGMVHLLGIKDSVDFKKASQYFSNQSLANDADARRLLGFIAEHEGNHSLAFRNYEYASSNRANTSYLDKVIKERENLQDFLKEKGLPIILNTKISAILGAYNKDKTSKLDACVEIAAICNDQYSVLEVAQNLYNAGDYLPAKLWLQRGGIASDHPLYVSTNEKLEQSKTSFDLSKSIQTIEIIGETLLSKYNTFQPMTEVKKSYDEAASSCKLLWERMIQKQIAALMEDYEVMERKAALEAEAAKKKKKQDTKDFINGWLFISVIIGVILYFVGFDSVIGIIIEVVYGIILLLALYGSLSNNEKKS